MNDSGRFGITSDRCGAPAGIPVSGIAGDQQAALFGQACFAPGTAKNTYGTGSFVLMNVGDRCPPSTEGMLTTVAWTLADGTTAYALEGSIFVTGAAIQWLRDVLSIIDSAPEIGPLAASVTDTAGCSWCRPTRGSAARTGTRTPAARSSGSRAAPLGHLARATVEAMAYQTRDVVDAMVAASGTPLSELRVDGGASVMDLLMQLQADQLGVVVRRPRDQAWSAWGR